MGRPAKSAALKSGHMTKDEKEKREIAEGMFRDGKKITPPKQLTKKQKSIFKFLISSLPEKILCGLDIYILTITAISIDRIQSLEFALNRLEDGCTDEDDEKMLKVLLRDRDKYMKDFFRCCNELCLSPQSRAKIGTAMTAESEAEKDPLASILSKYSGDV